MSRLTIVHAAKFYPPVRGGMETVIADLCNGTAAEWDVRVVAANTDARTIEERCGAVTVVRAGAVGLVNSVPLCPSLPGRLWRSAADCIVLHEPNPVAGTALFLRTPAPRLIVWHHSDLVRPWWAPHTYGRIQRALYARADCVIVSSPNLAEGSSLVGHARRVEVIPFGVPVENYRRDDAARRAQVARIRAAAPGLRVLFVGRFVYYKGVDILVDAMADCPGTLVLIGEGPLEPQLRQQVRDRGLQDRVQFIGRVSDEELPAYYQAADVFVLPSIARTEAFGVVQVESMAAGVPVISTRLPTGVPWVNQDGITGLVVAPGDRRALADAIRRVLTDDSLRSTLAANAAVRAETLFGRSRMVDAFRKVVEGIAGVQRRPHPALAQVQPS
jgi:glycosyltransferase involved in cell wall biosynthesis